MIHPLGTIIYIYPGNQNESSMFRPRFKSLSTCPRWSQSRDLETWTWCGVRWSWPSGISSLLALQIECFDLPDIMVLQIECSDFGFMTSRSIDRSICWSIYFSMCFSVCLTISLLICFPVSLFLNFFIYLSIRWSLYLYVFFSLSLFLYFWISLSIHLSLYLYFLSFSLSLSLSFTLCFFLSLFCSLSIYIIESSSIQPNLTEVAVRCSQDPWRFATNPCDRSGHRVLRETIFKRKQIALLNRFLLFLVF